MEKLFAPEKIFVILALFFGLLLAILTPPYQVPDEPQHFYRALSLTKSKVIAIKLNNNTGDYLPADLDEIHEKYVPIIKNLDKKTSYQDFKKSLKFKYNNRKLMFFNFPNTALYSPICYIPQIIGIFTAKLFTQALVAILLFGRLFSLFFFIAMGYMTIKTIPVIKWGTLLVLLTPMNLIIASGFSADTVLFCLSAFYFAKIMQCCFSDNKLTKREVILFSLIALLIALTKQSFLFTLFILLIPKKKFGNKYLLKLSLILLPALLLAIVWSCIIKSIYIPLNGADIYLQTQYIINHPLEYATVLFKPTYDSLIILYEAICIMGWLEMSIPKYYYFLYIAMFILNSFIVSAAENNQKLNTIKNLILLVLCLINYIAISTLLYLSWAAPGNFYPTMVLQGRYFSILMLPVSTMLYMIIPHVKSKYAKILHIITVLFLISMLTQVVYTIFIRYY